MNIGLVLLLNALTIVGVGLFARAWMRGLRFGERLEARQKADRERREARRARLELEQTNS
ncbi:MAG: hypothetical protein ACX93N_05600 [Pseudohaliea sp.]